ncbi:metal ABC transporter solute-binding protein, Zn/Mn family [Clostridium sp.]|uniref:metal ABC transporter solute-binding protein, Zn/Mn family n=1 Tax=Clostridium sp. TaxID=1506 RepID=UPI00284CE1D1|nr:zinc ABC transporter substrate-binding protein [Clostridium sp.]MDR3597670.1 zinc ABC transporter substrate-binding protein [Clostridium sp.]
MKQYDFIIKSKAKSVLKVSALSLSLFLGVAGCSAQNSSSNSNSSSSKTDDKVVQAVGAENEYADVIKQIGGDYVSVTAIMSDVGTDPHSYESNTKDSEAVSKATLIVENGLGYDDFMDKLEESSSNSNRTVIDVAKSLNYGDDTKNPHLWYKPDTMPQVAKLIAKNLENQLPDKKDYFEGNLSKFNDSLKAYNDDLKQIQDSYAKTGVAVTEPVADYLLEAANLEVKTPWDYQASIMNDTDPSPQNVKIQEDLLKNKQVKVFLYNQQAIDDSTTALLQLAKDNNIPIVGVYETMPPNHTYQTWMQAEAENIVKALKDGVSTEKLS